MGTICPAQAGVIPIPDRGVGNGNDLSRASGGDPG